MSQLIVAVGHVALGVRDLDAAVDGATSIMGLHETERADGWVYLTHDSSHHSLQCRVSDADAVDHIGLVAAGQGALAELRTKLEREGVSLLDGRPLDRGIEAALVFVGPEDFVFEAYVGMAAVEPVLSSAGVTPSRFGHVTLTVKDPAAMSDFFQRVLSFRVSDVVGDGYFLRCNADHHGIGILAGAGVLHHHAWEVPSIADLARLGDRLAELGQFLLWGPVRHGAGGNIAAYYLDSSGAVVEYYTEMERIYDDAAYVLPSWDMEDQRWYSLWAPGIPESMNDFGVPPVQRAAAEPRAAPGQ